MNTEIYNLKKMYKLYKNQFNEINPDLEENKRTMLNLIYRNLIKTSKTINQEAYFNSIKPNNSKIEFSNENIECLSDLEKIIKSEKIIIGISNAESKYTQRGYKGQAVYLSNF